MSKNLSIENALLKEKMIELKCLIIEREKILESIKTFLDGEEIDESTSAEWLSGMVLAKVDCKTDIGFSLIDRDITIKNSDPIGKRLDNVGEL